MDVRTAGPLAALWPDLTPSALQGLLLPPAEALPAGGVPERGEWLAQAEAERGSPWPQVTAHAWARFRRDGDRAEYETALFARTDRLVRAVAAAAATGERAWLDEAADGLVLLADQSSWCWPAHDDAWQTAGAMVPDVTRPFLDLGAGEAGALVAWAWHLLAGPLQERWPGLGERLKLETGERVLTPFLQRRDWHWLGLDGPVHNWNPWIHSNVITAALRLEDDPARRAEIVWTALSGLDRYLAALPPDGAIDEGPAYWWQGACRALEALALVKHATAGALDGLGLAPLRETLKFPYRTSFGRRWCVDFADAWARPGGEQPWEALFRFAKLMGDGQAADFALAHRRPGGPLAEPHDGLGRFWPGITNAAWRDAAPAAEPLPRDVFLPSVAWFLARAQAGSAQGLAVAAKGGHNGENHNHLDVGSVIVALDAVPVLADAGRTAYTAQTFGPGRYGIWALRSDWHNVPDFPPHGLQGVGAEFAARDVTWEAADGAAAFGLELAGAYPPGLAASWRRTVRLERGDAPRVEIHDAWTLGAGAPDPVLTWLVAGRDVAETAGGLSVETLDGGRAELSLSPALAATLEARPLDDPELVKVWGSTLWRWRVAAAGVRAATLTIRAGAGNRT